MCPSFKVTRDLHHSPKGRADALGHWHRAYRQHYADEQLESDMLSALDGCLGCKGCATGCPVQTDIPRMKSHFLGTLYQKRRRPLADGVSRLEEYSWIIERYRKVFAIAPRITNAMTERMTGLRVNSSFIAAKMGVPARTHGRRSSPHSMRLSNSPQRDVAAWLDCLATRSGIST